MNNPVGWFEIDVKDMARAKSIDEAMLGVSLSKLESAGLDMWAFSMNPEGYGASGAVVIDTEGKHAGLAFDGLKHTAVAGAPHGVETIGCGLCHVINF